MIDINLNPTPNTMITDKLELFFQEIYLAVNIAPGEIWGITESIDLAKYLWNQYVTVNQIETEIQKYVGQNCSMATEFQYTVKVELMNLDNKEFIYINFTIYDSVSDRQFLQKYMVGQ